MFEQILKPNREKLNLKDVEIDISDQSPDYMDRHDVDLARFPHFYYGEHQLDPSTMELVDLDFNGFVPTLSITFYDLQGFIYKYGLPIDDAKITLMFPSANKTLGNIFMEFKIESYSVKTHESENLKKFEMICILNVNELLLYEMKTYKNMTSFEVFQEFARESGLGFISNVSSTNDRMDWINFNKRNFKFLEEVRDASWRNEDSFMWAYIDPYYNLVLVDVEKAMSQSLKEIVWAMDDLFSAEGESNDGTTGPPVLSTSGEYNTTNIFVADYFLHNNSTEISLEHGYTRKIHYYDIDGNWSKRAGHYYKYDMDTITTPGSENNTIYAKSNDADFYKRNVRHLYGGILDTSNVHPDYFWAQAQNKENIRELEKFVVQVVLNKQNFNIKRFERLQLHIINNTQTADNSNRGKVNKQLTNNYIVIGFNLEFYGNSVAQFVNLVSREVQLPF